MVAYGATKAFDMVFAEALWAELHDKGVDVLGLILGKTDTPALRELEHSRGQISSPDEVPAGAVSAEEVIAEAFENLTNGPTWMAGDMMRAGRMLANAVRSCSVVSPSRLSSSSLGAFAVPTSSLSVTL